MYMKHVYINMKCIYIYILPNLTRAILSSFFFFHLAKDGVQSYAHTK